MPEGDSPSGSGGPGSDSVRRGPRGGAPTGTGLGGAGPEEGQRRRPGKLSFKEQRELEGIESAVLAAEERKSALEAALSDPATYQKDGAAVGGMQVELAQVTAEVERLYARWQELESLRAAT
jgi:ATP-binding cassette subfamily F protein uup